LLWSAGLHGWLVWARCALLRGLKAEFLDAPSISPGWWLLFSSWLSTWSLLAWAQLSRSWKGSRRYCPLMFISLFVSYASIYGRRESWYSYVLVCGLRWTWLKYYVLDRSSVIYFTISCISIDWPINDVCYSHPLLLAPLLLFFSFLSTPMHVTSSIS